MKHPAIYCLLLTACTTSVVAQAWLPQTSPTTASLRGVSAVSKNVAWASGTKGTILRTIDGGKTWLLTGLPLEPTLDFRDIEAIDDRTAYAMSAGPGALSRVYKTSNSGTDWTLQITNPDPQGFWDCMSFWNSKHGILVGDPVDGRISILTTEDGTTWRKRTGPLVNKDEAMFAASGTCVVTRGTAEAWLATGGQGGGRVFHSVDGGETWSIATTSVRHESASAGIFSIGFADSRHGISVGGNYSKPTEAADALALTADGGKNWNSAMGLSGFRSAVAYVTKRKLWVATGTSGTDVSRDGGKSWKNIGSGFNALSFTSNGVGWAVGVNGAISLFK